MGLMMRRRRPVARAAMMAGGAAVAYHAGKKSGTAQGAEQQASADPQYQQQAPAPAPGGADMVAQLEQLKKLLDEGVLTQAEFDAQKAKILQGS
jgi:membrane protease subunit (stomatin/prohibitin family)